jgi:hypothetical protein
MQQLFRGVPCIEAEVIFLRSEEGGRRQLPNFSPSKLYVPHILVESRSRSIQVVGRDGAPSLLYEAVAFVEALSPLEVGSPGLVRIALMYYPRTIIRPYSPALLSRYGRAERLWRTELCYGDPVLWLSD